MAGGLNKVAASATQVGNAAQQAAPKVQTQEKVLKELSHSAEETTRGLMGMALAARRGSEAFPELALATREAWTGLKGVNAGMAELGAASRLMVVGLGAVVIGIGAVGAAVAAYGVSVFKFSQEMYTLSQTAKSLGMTFGQLRNITEQNERFGISVDATVGQIGKMNEVLTDLSMSGSKVRQSLMAQGVPAQWITDYQKLTNEVDRYNKVREGQIKVHDDWKKRTGSEEIAATQAGQFGQRLGVDPTAWTREPLKQATHEEEEQAARIAKHSEEIAKQWRETLKIINEIKTEFLAWGLPGIAPIITGINEGLKTTVHLFEAIGHAITGIKNLTPNWLGTAISKGWAAERGAFGGLITGGPIGALRGGYKALQESGQPAAPSVHGFGDQPAAPAAPPTPETEGGITGWYHRRNREKEEALKHPSSFRGANDNVNPLLHNASFGDGFGGGGGSEGGRAQAIIKGGVYEALVEFYSFLQTGGAGRGGAGGVQNASLTTGGAAAGGTGGVFDSFRKGGGIVGGGGGGAAPGGGSVIPSDQEMAAKDRAWLGKARVGGGGGGGEAPHGSHVGAGAGEGAGETPAGGPGGGDTSKVGNEYLASQRERLKKELDDNPELKRRFAAIIQTENATAGKQVAESAMNRAIMTGRSMASILGGGSKSFYGPVRRGVIEPTMRNMSARDLAGRYAQIDAGLAGGNTVRGATDQGSKGDPNYEAGGQAVPDVNRERFGYWGGYKGVAASKRWAQQQQEQVNKSAAEAAATAKASADVKASAAVPGAAGPGPVSERYSTRRLQGEEGGQDETSGGQGGADTTGNAPLKRVYIGPQSSLDRGALDRPLDRSALNDSSSIHSTANLSVDVRAPAGTKVNYDGDNLLKPTSMQRQTQMMPTDTGPSVGDTTRSNMRGAA